MLLRNLQTVGFLGLGVVGRWGMSLRKLIAVSAVLLRNLETAGFLGSGWWVGAACLCANCQPCVHAFA